MLRRRKNFAGPLHLIVRLLNSVHLSSPRGTLCYFFGNKTCFLSLFSNQEYDEIGIYKMGNLTNYVSGGGESPGFSVTFSINGCRLCKWG